MNGSLLHEMFSLEGSTVVLTGAGGTLAGEMAVAVARLGANAVILDLSLEAAEKVSAAAREHGGEAMAMECDVLDWKNLNTCCEKILKQYGKIDCLVNGAGGSRAEATTSESLPFFDISPDVQKQVMDLNFNGTLFPCQVFGKEIAKQDRGSIVNIASISGFRPLTKAAAYAAGKAVVINFTRWLAVHFCQHYSSGIRVNALAPGFFATDQNRYLLFDESGGLTRRGEDILGKVPQKRFGDPAELTAAVVWLLSDSASFVTGSVITIDGGFDALSGV
jgi:NAD(P)-dependent dehydrogenase (short-subunit alcohol dehydrogenase family)